MIQMLSILIIYIFLFGGFIIKIKPKVTTYILEVKGLVWIALDHYTIWKYNSTDEPKQFIKIYKYE